VALIWSAAQTLVDPEGTSRARGGHLDALLPLAGWHFTLGLFLFTGFMSRFVGLLLVGLAVWEVLTIGPAPLGLAAALLGLYFMLRGGGAWAMDIYVQMMQDRVRQREARERAERERAGETAARPSAP
jgi:hypothetical protein